ncbi:MAG TPA: glycoside-pentoside-hexuronide (GPH):cation symporter [Steroidobacteraceae bacterium]
MSAAGNVMSGTAAGAQEGKLTLRRYVGYGLGDFAFNFYWLPLQVFLLNYYTDVLGLSSSAAGTVIMICLVWDGIIDPLIGIVANRTRSRFGRYRPYMLFGCVPLAASFALMFMPAPFHDASLVAYALATQLLFRTMYAAVNIPYGAMMASMTRSSIERNWLAGVRMLFAFSGSAIVGYYTPRLVVWFGVNDESTAYLWATAVLGACAVAVLLVCYALTEERVELEGDEAHPQIRAMLAMIVRNVPFLQIMGGIALFSFANIAFNASLPYFIQYYMGEDKEITGNVAGMVPFVQMLAIMPWAFASRFIGKRGAWIAGLALAAAALLVLYALDRPTMTAVYWLVGIYAVGTASIAVNFWSIVPDTVEYGEWRSGVRAEGFIFGFVTLVQKVSLGISSAFVGSYLAWIGYAANQAQTTATLGGLKFLITGAVGLGLAASCAVMCFYRLNAERHGDLVREIAARRARNAAGDTA